MPVSGFVFYPVIFFRVNLFFGSVCEVAGIAETRHDVAVSVNFGVDYSYPQFCVFRQNCLKIVYGFLRSDY